MKRKLKLAIQQKKTQIGAVSSSYVLILMTGVSSMVGAYIAMEDLRLEIPLILLVWVVAIAVGALCMWISWSIGRCSNQVNKQLDEKSIRRRILSFGMPLILYVWAFCSVWPSHQIIKLLVDR